MKSDLIVFGEDWGAHPSSTQHLIKYLSKTRRTLWINSIGLRRPKVSIRDMKRIVQKGLSIAKKSAHKIEETKPIDVLPPKAIPWPGNPIAKHLNRHILGKQIKEKLNELEISKPILWTSLPTAVDVIDQFDEQAVVYYCGDDFGALDGVDHSPVVACEERLVERADLIIAASDKLAEKFPTQKTVVLPHGVDFDLFSKPVKPAPECETKRPIAGFYGSIAQWVDVELVAQTAIAMPDWDFMFVGPVKTDISSLTGIGNIKFVGPQPHDKLPSFIQHWQAALLPFKDNDQIRACNPLKLREYLASGTPVVTTDFPALEGYRDQVNVVDDVVEMVKTLQNVRRDEGQSDCVVQESWKKRASDLDTILSCWDHAC